MSNDKKLLISTKFSETMKDTKYVDGIVITPFPQTMITYANNPAGTPSEPDEVHPIEFPMNGLFKQVKVQVYGKDSQTAEPEIDAGTINRSSDILYPLKLDDFNLKLNSTSDFKYTIEKKERHWIIRRGNFLCFKPAILPYLPPKFDNFLVRLGLLPFELLLKALKAPVELALVAISVFRYKNGDTPETTNIQVGDDGDG